MCGILTGRAYGMSGRLFFNVNFCVAARGFAPVARGWANQVCVQAIWAPW